MFNHLLANDISTVLRSRYNLKRRVASLPPISSEMFAEKVLSAQASSSAAAAKATFEKSCPACQKTYYSENAFLNHMNSQKHRLNEAALRKDGTRDETGSVISGAFSAGEPIDGPASEALAENGMRDEGSDIVDGVKGMRLKTDDGTTLAHPSQDGSFEEGPGLSSEKTTDENYHLLHCLFCNYKSPNLKLNVHHMSKLHGMFLPEQGYLVDLEGLLKYFFSKITKNNECLYCHKIKQTTSGIQNHMRDKGHCMVAFETDEEMIEVGQFYDFSSTYSDVEDDEDEDEAEKGGAPVGADDGWETDSSVSSLDSDEIGALPIDDHSHQYAKLPNHKHHAHQDPRPHRNADGFHSRAHTYNHAAFYSDYELHLPSGRTAGHRSLARYYRQNLRNYATTPEDRIERQRAIEAASSNDTEDGDNSNRALTTRANGGIGMLGTTDDQKREARASQARGRELENRSRRQYQRGVDKRSNYQKHFRVSTFLIITDVLLLFYRRALADCNSLLGPSPAIAPEYHCSGLSHLHSHVV